MSRPWVPCPRLLLSMALSGALAAAACSGQAPTAPETAVSAGSGLVRGRDGRRAGLGGERGRQPVSFGGLPHAAPGGQRGRDRGRGGGGRHLQPLPVHRPRSRRRAALLVRLRRGRHRGPDRPLPRDPPLRGGRLRVRVHDRGGLRDRSPAGTQGLPDVPGVRERAVPRAGRPVRAGRVHRTARSPGTSRPTGPATRSPSGPRRGHG